MIEPFDFADTLQTAFVLIVAFALGTLIGAERQYRQRNAGLRHIAGRADIVTFFDDDFVPAADYLAVVGDIFVQRPDVVGATGRLIADGITTGGFSLADAVALV